MKCLAVFYFIYEPFEVRVMYKDGYLCIREWDVRWWLPTEYYTRPKDIHDLIRYHRECINWVEL